ncbi:MAG TPA: acetylglutamate kinase [Dehalococcoidia bacterium]|nr:acetylglutamate kinase [Dehalococcoidia bacterium]
MDVVKIGGSTLGQGDTTLADLAALHGAGARVVVVHGGGDAITHWLSIHGVEAAFRRGLRVTDERALPVVVAVLAGLVNKELVAALDAAGARALGLSGADGGLIRAHHADPELGYVGEIEAVDSAILRSLLQEGYLPVIAPLALGPGGTLLNINADTAAAAVAVSLEAQRLVFLTDVPGVIDGRGEVQARLTPAGAQALLDQGAISGGMVPKIEAALAAARAGVEAFIIDGRQPGALARLLAGTPLAKGPRPEPAGIMGTSIG